MLFFFIGGGSGIGKAVCELFAKQGASIAVVDINAASAEKTARSLPPTDAEHSSYAVDISNHGAVGELVRNIAQVSE